MPSKWVCGALIIHMFHFTKNLWALDGTHCRLRTVVGILTFDLMRFRLGQRCHICSDACERFDLVLFNAPIVIWDYIVRNPCLQEMGFSTTQSTDSMRGVQVKVTLHANAV